jgi:glycosyltransferase involved in cell wall biosynthesis
MHVLILGTRGVPSRHGGFETFAQDFALFLLSRGHEVTVYCQVAEDETAREDTWHGIRRVLIPVADNAPGAMLFDWRAIKHSLHEKGVVLTLGYNTGLFNLVYRLSGQPNIMNMDGIEWKREKWSPAAKAWLWLNEWAGARLANHLIADHPEIKRHLSRHTASEKITVLPYGAETVASAPRTLLQKYGLGLSPNEYYVLVARSEPENSILEIVKAYSVRQRGMPLVILGNYRSDASSYQKAVLDAAGPEVIFPGVIFDRAVVRALRFHCRAYFHGHRVGGTNPSLVESLAAGAPIIAHDNRFTRWVAGNAARYFQSSEDIDGILHSLSADPGQLTAMKEASQKRHYEAFTQDKVLSAYEELLLGFASTVAAAAPGDLREAS